MPSDTSIPFSFTPDNVLNTVQRGENDLTQAYTIGNTYLVGPNTVNALRLSVNRSAIGTIGAKFFSACDVGVKMYCGYAPTIMTVNITGGFSLNSQSPNDTRFHPHTYSVSDDVSVVHGTHQM